MTFTNDFGTTRFSEIQSGTNDGKVNTFLTGQDAQNHLIRCGKSLVLIRESGQITIRCDPNDNTKEIEEEKLEGVVGSYGGGEMCAKIEIDGDGNVRVYSDDTVTVTSPQVSIKGDTVEIEADNFAVNANSMVVNSGFVNLSAEEYVYVGTQAVNVDAGEKILVTTPDMYVDAKEGSFIAQGKDHPPVSAL